jgi:hypothetical protein
MTTIPPVIDEAETLVRDLAAELTSVHDGECLCCYVARQLSEYPCDHTHRHAIRYRDAKAPRATGLLERLSRVGACCCDCELFLNAYEPDPRLDAAESDRYAGYVAAVVVAAPWVSLLPDRPVACAGVRRGSVRPCGNWVRLRRG